MWKLILHHGDQMTEIFLISGHEYTVGRTPSNEIYINHPTISRAHAALVIQEDHVIIQDLGSKNGTFVNEQPVKDSITVHESVPIRLGSVPVFLEKVAPRPQDAPVPETFSTYEIDPSLQFFLRSETLHEFQRTWSFLNDLSQELQRLKKTHLDGPTFFKQGLKIFARSLPLQSYALIDAKDFPDQEPRVIISEGINPTDPRVRWAAETACNLIRPTWALLTRERAAVVIPIVQNHILYLNVPPETIIHNKHRTPFIIAIFLLIQAWLEMGTKVGVESGQRWDAWLPFPFWGYSPRIYTLIQRIRELAPGTRNLYLYGPPGTGKKELARLIHQISQRKGSFVAFDTSNPDALIYRTPSEGPTDPKLSTQWWRLHRGTVALQPFDQFLQEKQTKLVDFLRAPYLLQPSSNNQTRLDIRWILIGHRSPDELQALGIIHPTLWEAFDPVIINVPALRDRKEDIPYLATHLVQQLSHGQVRGFVPDALQLLVMHTWPNNLNELHHTLSSVVTTLMKRSPAPSLLIRPDDLLPHLPPAIQHEWDRWHTAQNAFNPLPEKSSGDS